MICLIEYVGNYSRKNPADRCIQMYVLDFFMEIYLETKSENKEGCFGITKKNLIFSF